MINQPRQPTAVHRKSKPSDLGMIGAYQFDYSTENVVYLRFSEALETGRTYELSFPGSGLAAVSFTVDPTRLRSEAMRVSQIGFRPDDPAKIAFLSCWMGVYRAFLGRRDLPTRAGMAGTRGHWDVFWDRLVCEYAVHKPMAGTAYDWGYLAARPKLATRSIDSERE